MRRTLLFASLTAGLRDNRTRGHAKTEKNQNQVVSELATDQDYKWLQSIKEITGSLAGVSTFSITFRLDTPHMEPNPKYKPPKANAGKISKLRRILSIASKPSAEDERSRSTPTPHAAASDV